MTPNYLVAIAAKPLYFVSLFFLTLARIMPIVAMAPFFGAKVMPVRAKVGLSIALAAIFMPFLMHITKVELTFDSTLVAFAFKEIIIGFILGFLSTVPFSIAQMAGIVIDHQRGSSSLMVNDPTTSSQVSSIGLFYNYMMIVVFFSIDGPFLFLDSVMKSYQSIPPDIFPMASFFQLDSAFWTTIVGLLTYLTSLSCQMAAPSLLMILMSNVFLGIMNRLAPQVQITFLGMSLNAYLGDLALWAAWLLIIDRFGIEPLVWLKSLTSLIQTVAVPA
ncbi:MAG: flagellar biosynthetic protein FliR [Parachlamydiales bacterium]|nr:flagellar biosynthetic protein FliR [Parachlamydiales bacterium]